MQLRCFRCLKPVFRYLKIEMSLHILDISRYSEIEGQISNKISLNVYISQNSHSCFSVCSFSV